MTSLPIVTHLQNPKNKSSGGVFQLNQRNKKIVFILLLFLQNTVCIIIIRKSFKISEYSAATAVMLAEVLKFAVSLFFLRQSQTYKEIAMTYIKCPKDKAKILAIALIYSFQNLLNYYALRKLEAVYFQIFNQLKIITTALFSVALLSTRISSRKWAALVLLAGGAAFIQVEQAYLLAVPKEELHLNVDISEALGKSAKFSDSFKGFIACLIAALTSGFAGVCYEKIIKGKNLDMWQTNVDLSLFSIGISTFVVFFDKGVRANGFFAGYNLLTAGSVVVTGCGGLLVSAVVKYSSTIIKGFVVSFGIVACALLDFFSNSVKPSVCFLVSLCVVLLAVQLYNF